MASEAFFVSWVCLYALATIGLWKGHAIAWAVSLLIPVTMLVFQLTHFLTNAPANSLPAFARAYWPELLLVSLFCANASTLWGKLSRLFTIFPMVGRAPRE